MSTVCMTAFERAQRYVGLREVDGSKNHPLVVWWLSLCGLGAADFSGLNDEIPWCSAFVNGVAWDLRLPRSKSAAARSWLKVGTPTTIVQAQPAFDVVILKRGPDPQPGPEVTSGAPGHVGFYAGMDADGSVLVLGGNQSDEVSIAPMRRDKVLGVRRLLA